MPDKKLEYWKDWRILGPDGKEWFNLKDPLITIDPVKLKDIDDLCDLIENHPHRLWGRTEIWNHIIELKIIASGNQSIMEKLRQLGKSIKGDKRKTKSKEQLDDISKIALNDLDFFKYILDLISKKGFNIDTAIKEYLLENVTSQAGVDKRLRETSNYRNTFYTYRKIYKKLRAKMRDNEIFGFLTIAAHNIGYSEISVSGKRGRRFTFVKTRMWYARSGKRRRIWT
jgi:hypothetical protein